MRSVPRLAALPGRGALSNHPSRYDAVVTDRTYASELATHDDAPPRARPTRLHRDEARSIISTNQSPDVPFAQSINPYRGCEHGCIYCFARPSHARLGWSPGLDFEAEIHFKPDARALLEAALARPGYRPQPIHLGANTDPYQPVERRLQLTRSLLEGFLEARHPVTVLTKGALIERDLDLLAELARLAPGVPSYFTEASYFQKDWQQAQNDVIAAQSDQRSAEAALQAVRNRLRLLGKSDQEIDAFARTQGTAKRIRYAACRPDRPRCGRAPSPSRTGCQGRAKCES